jgi:hypothetical protein
LSDSRPRALARPPCQSWATMRPRFSWTRSTIAFHPAVCSSVHRPGVRSKALDLGPTLMPSLMISGRPRALRKRHLESKRSSCRLAVSRRSGLAPDNAFGTFM